MPNCIELRCCTRQTSPPDVITFIQVTRISVLPESMDRALDFLRVVAVAIVPLDMFVPREVPLQRPVLAQILAIQILRTDTAHPDPAARVLFQRRTRIITVPHKRRMITTALDMQGAQQL